MPKLSSNVYTGGTGTALDKFFSNKAIEALFPNTFFMKAATYKTLPKGVQKYVFNLATKSVGTVSGLTISEGVTPNEGSWAMTQAEVSLTQLGEYVPVSDVLLEDSPVPLLGEIVSDLAANLATVADIFIQDVVDAGTNVIYSGTAAARNEISTNENLTVADLSEAATELKSGFAKPYEGNKYLAISHPRTLHDLKLETGTGGWLEANKYATPEKIFNGEVGSIAGVRVIESANVQFYADAGNGSGSTGTIDVYPTYVFGKDAFGVVTNGDPETIYTPAGGISDPLKQRAAVGVKMRIGATILRTAALYRIESASTIGSNS